MGRMLKIPDSNVFERIRNDVLTKDMQDWLYQTYQNSSTLGDCIIACIDGGWAAVNRATIKDRVKLTFPLSDYHISDIVVIERSLPNHLKEYLSQIGCDNMFVYPETFKCGLVITLKFTQYTPDILTGTPILMSSFYVSDIYIMTKTSIASYYRCMTNLE